MTLLMFDTGITHESHPSFPRLVKVETLVDFDYAEKIPLDPWLKALEDMASYYARDDVHVDVVVISSGFKQRNIRMKDAITTLVSNGVIVVCAAGNDGEKNIHNVKYPARFSQTTCVGAHDRNGRPCGFHQLVVKYMFLH